MTTSYYPLGDAGKPYAEVMADERRVRDERRSQDLAELRSDLNSPQARIRLWEKLHQVQMPRHPGHPVLEVIAASTHLTLAEVEEEQRLRAAHTAHKPPA